MPRVMEWVQWFHTDFQTRKKKPSRSLTAADCNYSQIEKEALALIFAVKNFHRMLFGRKFTLLTDHKPLLSIFGSKKCIPVYSASWLQCWATILLGYNFTIQYQKTTAFGQADALSQLFGSQRSPEEDTVNAAISVDGDFQCTFNDCLIASTNSNGYKVWNQNGFTQVFRFIQGP